MVCGGTGWKTTIIRLGTNPWRGESEVLACEYDEMDGQCEEDEVEKERREEEKEKDARQ